MRSSLCKILIHDHCNLEKSFSIDNSICLQVFTVIEAMADGINARDIPHSIGIEIAAQTAAGAARIALKSAKHPAILRDEVHTLIEFTFKMN